MTTFVRLRQSRRQRNLDRRIARIRISRPNPEPDAVGKGVLLSTARWWRRAMLRAHLSSLTERTKE